MTKTEKVKQLLSQGQWKPALSILRQFRFEFTREQKRLIQISADVLNGHGKFYESLGIDTACTLNMCKELLTAKYLK